jgi:flagellar biosynthetic protein FlhB
MSDSSDDRIHPATPARQQTIWRDGDFAKSFELAASIQLIGALVVAVALFRNLAGWLKSMMLTTYSTASLTTTLSTTDLISQLQSLLFSSLGIIGLIGTCLVVVNLLAHWSQTGIMLLGNKVSPDIAKLSPGNWLAKLFSRSNLIFTLLCLPKIVIALAAMAGGYWVYRDQFFQLGTLPADEMGGAILKLTLTICGAVAGVLLIGSSIDYWMKYMSYQNRIRMTEQELREEAKMQSRKGAGV